MKTTRLHSYAQHFHKEHMVEIRGPDEAYSTIMRHNENMMEEKAQLLRALKFLTVYEMLLRRDFDPTKDNQRPQKLVDRVRMISRLEDMSDHYDVGRAIQEHIESYFNNDERREVYDLMEIVEQC